MAKLLVSMETEHFQAAQLMNGLEAVRWNLNYNFPDLKTCGWTVVGEEGAAVAVIKPPL